MTQRHNMVLGPRVQAAVAELETLIRGRYPDAKFEVSVSVDDSTPATCMRRSALPTAMTCSTWSCPRLFELQDTVLPIYVIPLQIPDREEKVRRELHAEHRLAL